MFKAPPAPPGRPPFRRSILLVLCAFFFVSGYSQITSTFDTDVDGWQVEPYGGPLNTPTWNGSGGNPGGYASADLPSNNTQFYYWVAPSKFLGNICSSSYGQYLHFDMLFTGSSTTQALLHGDIILKSATGTIVMDLPTKPNGTWNTFNIKLDESVALWHVTDMSGLLATRLQIVDVISNLTSIQINGDYQGSTATPGTTKLDNVTLDQEVLGTPPTITSFSPATGIPGTTVVTILGTNFNSTASNNYVFFGGVRATPTSGNSTQLNVPVPAEARLSQLVVIDKATGLSAQSSKLFVPVFNNNGDNGGQIIRATLDPPVLFDISASAQEVQSMASGDIDGDGLTDVVIGEVSAHGFSVFRNTGQTNSVTTSSFDPKVTFTVTNTSGKAFIALADFDGDGKIDVAFSNASSAGSQSYVSVFHNTSTPGSLSFDPPIDYYALSYSDGPIQAADMDGDGRPEIIGMYDNDCSTGNRLYIYPNRSTPGNIQFCSFQTFGPIATCGGYLSLGDLDGDGKPEVVFGGVSQITVSIFHNTSTPGNIQVAAPFNVETTHSNGKVAIVDIDGDGKNDLAYAYLGVSQNFVVRKNNYSTGTLSATDFAAPVAFASLLNGGFDDLTAGDINGDGKPDILVVNNTEFAIFQNNATTGTIDVNSFYHGVLYATNLVASNPFSPIIADIDNDNKPEVLLMTINSSPDELMVYKNECFPAPVISSATPASKGAGSTLTVTGSNFQTGVETPSIQASVGLLNSTANSPTSSSFTAKIPSGASTGRITATTHALTGYLSKPYDIHFGTNRTFDATTFGSEVDFALTGTPREAIITADLDNDGKIDVGVIDGSSTVRLFRNTRAADGETISTSTLTLDGTNFAGGFGMIAFDIDGDGLPDIASSQLFKNTSSPGAFSFNTGVSTPIGGNTFAIGDFNKDGKIDITATTGGLSVPVQANMSVPGIFTNSGSYSTMQNPVVNLTKPGANGGVTVADFDGDGYDDIAATSPTMNNFTFYHNAGQIGPITSSSFETGTDVTTDATPQSLTTADFDGDGKTDIAVVYRALGYFSVYRNTSTPGNISFAAKVDFNTTAATGYNIAVQDLDGDGKPEVVIILRPAVGTSSFDVFQNTGTSGTVSFNAANNYPISVFPGAVAIADINGDEKPDILIVGNGASNRLMVFENKLVSVNITITQQPSDVSACEGDVAVFNVTATGTTGLGYQWQYDPNTGVFSDVTNGGGYSGATSSSLSVNTSGNFGTGRYRCMVSGTNALDVTTNDEGLFINARPTAPSATPATICNNTTATLVASGATDGEYRWYTVATGGTAIAGEVNGTYTTPTLTTTTTYYVSINNGTCEGNRTAVTATIIPCLSIDTQPTDASVCDGTTANFTASASGTTNITYQWQFDPGTGSFTDISDGGGYSGATTGTLSVNTSGGFGAGNYQCVVGGDLVTPQTSNAATLAVLTLPSTPTVTGDAICTNTTATLSASGGTNGEYRWYTVATGGVAIVGEVNNAYTTPVLASSTTYYVAINDGACEGNRAAVTATVSPCLSIDTQPTDVSVCDGGVADFTVSGSGTTNITYQWQFDPGTGSFADISDAGGYSGATTGTLSVNTSGGFGAGNYQCVVGGDLATPQISNTAILNVLALPSAPSVFPGTTCENTSTTLSAFGGLNGEYRWYTVATGGTAIPGEVNSVYNTPVLTSNTTFYVAIDNGTCEGNRTAVTALVTPCISIDIQPADVSVCDGGIADFSVSGSGTTNITYQWQFDPGTGTFTDITDAGGYSGTTTSDLSVNTAGIFGAGRYQCVVQGDLASPNLSDIAVLTVNVIPAAPTVAGDTVCEGSNAILTASGAVSGQYRWYTVPSGGTPIAGASDGSYVATSIFVTTTFYASINNGYCEGPRTAVTAVTKACPTNVAPVINVPPLQTQVEGKITLDLTTLISDPDGNLDLSTLSIITPPTSGASATIDSNFNLILDYGGIPFAGNDHLIIGVCDLDGFCTQQEITVEVKGDIKIFNAVAPNGHDLNKKFTLLNIDFLSDTQQNHVAIYNRWGDVVFDIDNYDNVNRVFTGLNNSGNELPTGIYLYKITFTSRRAAITGFLYLKR